MPFTASQVSVASIFVPGVFKPDGTTIGITPGGILYDLTESVPVDRPASVKPSFVNAGIPIASPADLGIGRPDGVSILISPNGVLYASHAPVPPAPSVPLPASYVNAGLTAATAGDIGIAWVDGTSITVDANGVLSLVERATTFNCNVGDKDADSYVCRDRAEVLLSALPPSPGITKWLSLNHKAQEQSLVAATLVLDSLNWGGCVCDCQQRLQWPRRMKNCCGSDCSTIPEDIQLATAYMAAFMGEQGGFISFEAGGASGGGAGGLEPFSEVQVGPIKVKMKEGSTYGDTLATNIGQIPPFVADLIRRHLNAFGVSEGYMGRRSIARSWGTYIGSPSYSGTMYLRNGMVYPRIGGWASDMEGRRC